MNPSRTCLRATVGANLSRLLRTYRLHRFVANVIIFLLMGAMLLSGCSSPQPRPSPSPPAQGTHEHDNGRTEHHPSQLILSTNPGGVLPGKAVQLTGVIQDESEKPIKDFEPTHEKLVHLIIVREGLDEFAHIHPSIDAEGKLSVEHTFPKAGVYHLFADYKSKGSSPSTARTTLNVSGDISAAPSLTPDVPGRIQGNGLQADVGVETRDSAQIASFKILDSEGNAVTDLQPYLGAMGHLVVISESGADYVHAHPLDSKSDGGVVEFEVHFPGPGIYKAWGQFQRGGKIFTIPAVIDFNGGGHQH